MDINYLNIENSFTEMPINEPFVCSFSGGKDSVMALSMASQVGQVKGLIHWVDKRHNETKFHHQNLSIIEAQAQCMDIPLTTTESIPWLQRLDVINMYKSFAEKGIKSIVFGDIFVEESVMLQYVLCKKAGLIPRYPIWKKDYNQLVEELKNRRIKSIITRINTRLLEKKWLGHTYDEDIYKTFSALGIDPFGESGEFHTTVVDADVFQKPMKYHFYSKNDSEDSVCVSVTTHDHPITVTKIIK